MKPGYKIDLQGPLPFLFLFFSDISYLWTIREAFPLLQISKLQVVCKHGTSKSVLIKWNNVFIIWIPDLWTFFRSIQPTKIQLGEIRRPASILCFHLLFSPIFSKSFNTKPGLIIYFNEDHNHNDGGGDDGPCTNSNKTHLQLAVLFA